MTESMDLGFTYQIRKSGEIVISRGNRKVATLRGVAATAFLVEVASSDPQQVMARQTGNYRRGNERQAALHPRSDR